MPCPSVNPCGLEIKSVLEVSKAQLRGVGLNGSRSDKRFRFNACEQLFNHGDGQANHGHHPGPAGDLECRGCDRFSQHVLQYLRGVQANEVELTRLDGQIIKPREYKTRQSWQPHAKPSPQNSNSTPFLTLTPAPVLIPTMHLLDPNHAPSGRIASGFGR